MSTPTPEHDAARLEAVTMVLLGRVSGGTAEAEEAARTVLATADATDEANQVRRQAPYVHVPLDPATSWKFTHWDHGSLYDDRYATREECEMMARGMADNGNGWPHSITGPDGTVWDADALEDDGFTWVART